MRPDLFWQRRELAMPPPSGYFPCPTGAMAYSNVPDTQAAAMPHCTVRYSVRLKPKAADAPPMDAVGIFYEERIPDEMGEPGDLIWRRLNTFSGPTGYALKEAVTRKREWEMDVHDRIGPLVWDS